MEKKINWKKYLTKKNIILAVCLLVLFFGIHYLNSAQDLGIVKSQQYLASYDDGMMETEQYYIIVSSKILSYQILGGIMTLVGSIGTLLTVREK